MFIGNAFNFFDKRRCSRFAAQIDAINFSFRNVALVENPIFGLLFQRFVKILVFFIFICGQKRFTQLTANLVSIENPSCSTFKQPRQHNHIAFNTLQGKHSRTVRSQVIEIWDHRDVDPRFEYQLRDNIFLQPAFDRTVALTLRHDNCNSFSHNL